LKVVMTSFSHNRPSFSSSKNSPYLIMTEAMTQA
jgi:hypothetical protein